MNRSWWGKMENKQWWTDREGVVWLTVKSGNIPRDPFPKPQEQRQQIISSSLYIPSPPFTSFTFVFASSAGPLLLHTGDGHMETLITHADSGSNRTAWARKFYLVWIIWRKPWGIEMKAGSFHSECQKPRDTEREMRKIKQKPFCLLVALQHTQMRLWLESLRVTLN